MTSLSLVALSDGKTLKATWSPPRGQWEKYNVVLWNGSLALVNRTVSRPAQLFSGLVPGRSYRVEVSSLSGLPGRAALCQKTRRESFQRWRRKMVAV